MNGNTDVEKNVIVLPQDSCKSLKPMNKHNAVNNSGNLYVGHTKVKISIFLLKV